MPGSGTAIQKMHMQLPLVIEELYHGIRTDRKGKTVAQQKLSMLPLSRLGFAELR